MKNEIIYTTDQMVVQKIFMIRGHKVMIDRDLAKLYGVKTKVLNQAVKRNQKRFPEDFMFQLKREEKDDVVTNCDHLRGLKFSHQLPYAFTEHGILMLSSVLKSEKAIEVNIQIMRIFTKMRDWLATSARLRKKIEEMEKNYDAKFASIFRIMQHLLNEEKKPKQEIGFRTK